MSLSVPASASEPDWSDYSALLKAHVSPGEKHGVRLSLVDYPALAADQHWPHLLEQLAAQATAFLSRPSKGVSVQHSSIRVSRIFDWFEDDFQSRGGVLHFVQQYRPDMPPEMHLASYLDYDWSLNSRSGT